MLRLVTAARSLIRLDRLERFDVSLPVDTAGVQDEADFQAAAPIVDQAEASIEQIAREFQNPYLEACRLLREAANIEHALLVQYLYAGFSLKDRYLAARGGDRPPVTTMLGVAVQEMWHLDEVNGILIDLGAEPNMLRQDFPIETGIYPFALSLEPLTLASCAKYVVAEAPASALDPTLPENAADLPFIAAVLAQFGAQPIVHIGSLYSTIIAVVGELDPTAFPKKPSWLATLNDIKQQGVDGHYHYFRSMFEATHPVFGGQNVWVDPTSDIYPSLALPHNPSALLGHPDVIQPENVRQVAMLGNLHYWLVLGLIALGYLRNEVGPQRSLLSQAESHMVSALFPLGTTLARNGAGLPFDGLGISIGLSGLDVARVNALKAVIDEIGRLETACADDLPDEYSTGVAIATRHLLGG